jgi:integrase
MRPELGDDFRPWRLHDLRRSGASNLARMGTPIHVVAALLNHSPGSTMGIITVYARHRFADEKRRALEAWTAHVLGLAEPKNANVIRLHRSA